LITRSLVASLVLAAAIAATALDVQAQQTVPKTEAEFTRFVADWLQRALPGFSVKSAGQLTIATSTPDGEFAGQVSLDRVWEFCRSNTEQCPGAIAHFVSAVADVARDRAQPIEKAMVRLVVRPEGVVQQAKRQVATAAAPILFTRRLVGDLWVIAVLDFARSMRYVTTDDLNKLGLDKDTVFELGRRNLAESLKPLREVVQSLPPNGFGRLTEDDYESSRVILHAEWASVAEQLNQNLVVMVPASNLLLYGDGSTPAGVDAMRAFAAEAARRSQRPLSGTVLRWAPRGWQVVR